MTDERARSLQDLAAGAVGAPDGRSRATALHELQAALYPRPEAEAEDALVALLADSLGPLAPEEWLLAWMALERVAGPRESAEDACGRVLDLIPIRKQRARAEARRRERELGRGEQPAEAEEGDRTWRI